MHQHGAPMRPDGTVEPGAAISPDEVDFLIEKVWLANELNDLPDLPDGTRPFGLPEGARGNPDASSRAHAISVLASAGPTPFQGERHPYRAIATMPVASVAARGTGSSPSPTPRRRSRSS